MYDCWYGCFCKFKSIKVCDVGWSVLDVVFIFDGNYFFYFSWFDYIYICNIYGEGDIYIVLDFRLDECCFVVFFIVVFLDGWEVLGGVNDGCLYVFDWE